MCGATSDTSSFVYLWCTRFGRPKFDRRHLNLKATRRCCSSLESLGMI
ncbi:hypothetical protein M3J09_007532 [Ascochyta lentis]